MKPVIRQGDRLEEYAGKVLEGHYECYGRRVAAQWKCLGRWRELDGVAWALNKEQSAEAGNALARFHQASRHQRVRQRTAVR